MTVKIRQELNFLDGIEFVGIDSTESWALSAIACDQSAYNNESYYLEVIASNSHTSGMYASVFYGSDLASMTLDVTSGVLVPAGSDHVLLRSSVITPPQADLYAIGCGTYGSGSLLTIHSARLITIQSANSITATQTQIEIGQGLTEIPGAISTWYTIAEPKFWKYESSKWDPTPDSIKLGIIVGCEDDKESYAFGLYDLTDSDYAGGNLQNLISGVNTEDATFYLSSDFLSYLEDGHVYCLAYMGDDYKDELYFWNSKIIITQSDAGGIVRLQPEYLLINAAQSDTGRKNFNTYFDPDEWVGVDNIYYHEHSASQSGSYSRLRFEGVGVVRADLYSTGGSQFCVWGDQTFVYSGVGYDLWSYSIDSQGQITQLDSDYQSGNYRGVWGDGTFIFVAASNQGLYSYSVDGSGNLTQIDNDYQGTGEEYYDVFCDGNFIYVAAEDLGLLTYSVDGSGYLTFIDSDYQGSSYYRGVWGDGTFIYVGAGNDGIMSYSVDGSGYLTHIDTDDQGAGYDFIYGDDNFIYVSTLDGIMSYSVDGSGYLTHIDTDDQTGTYNGLWCDNDYIYIACATVGIRIYEADGSGYLTYIGAFGTGNFNDVWSDGNFLYAVTSTGYFISFEFDWDLFINSSAIGINLARSSAMTMPATSKEISPEIVTA